VRATTYSISRSSATSGCGRVMRSASGWSRSTPSIIRIGAFRGRIPTSAPSSERSSAPASRAACSSRCDTISELKNPWPNCRDLPPGPRAALAALHLTAPQLDPLRRLSESDWREALDYCDADRLTLALREVAREAMPEGVRARVEKSAAKQQVRARRFETLY